MTSITSSSDLECGLPPASVLLRQVWGQGTRSCLRMLIVLTMQYNTSIYPNSYPSHILICTDVLPLQEDVIVISLMVGLLFLSCAYCKPIMQFLWNKSSPLHWTRWYLMVSQYHCAHFQIRYVSIEASQYECHQCDFVIVATLPSTNVLCCIWIGFEYLA